MFVSILVGFVALTVASFLFGYWLDDLFNGCRAAVLSFLALAALYEGRLPVFSVAGFTSVVMLWVWFFACCFVLKLLRNELNRRKQRRLQAEAVTYQEHHHGDDRFSR